MIDASVIVVSYNVRDHLRRCLGSISTAALGRTLEVLVVDNGSHDGSVEAVRENFSDVALITNEANLGFAAANNLAIARARGRNLLFLNPDAELEPNALEMMLAYLDEHLDVGVVGPKLVFPDGRTQSSRRRFPTLITALVESTAVQRFWSGCPELDRYYVADRSADETQDVDWLVGACLLVRREAVEPLGGFDERFFMYSEELDLCRRIRDRGWRVVYLAAAQVIHHEGRSSEQNLSRRAQNFHESKCRYFEKYYGPSVGRALRLLLLANTSIDFLEEGLKLTLGHRPELRRTRLLNIAKVAAYQWHRVNGSSDVWPGTKRRT